MVPIAVLQRTMLPPGGDQLKHHSQKDAKSQYAPDEGCRPKQKNGGTYPGEGERQKFAVRRADHAAQDSQSAGGSKQRILGRHSQLRHNTDPPLC